MSFKDLSQSKTFQGILIGLLIFSVLAIVFQICVGFGHRQARFAGQFMNNFEDNFFGPRRGQLDGFEKGRLPSGHGAIGEIVGINLPQIIVSGPDALEKTIVINQTTTIRKFQDNIDQSKLSIGDFVVILGNPNESGQIDAKFIRIMPAPPQELKNNEAKQ